MKIFIYISFVIGIIPLLLVLSIKEQVRVERELIALEAGVQ